MGTAIPEERRRFILRETRQRSLVRAVELAQALGVSVESIRRDLLALEEEGLIRRIYGGAALPEDAEAAFDQRNTRHQANKIAIAQQAAELIEPGETLILDVGTTVAELARRLPPSYHGHVLTNSLLVASALADRDRVEVFCSGGRVRGGDLACSGSISDAFFRDHFADKSFLGSGGVHSRAGLTDFWFDEIATRQVIMEAAASNYVLADSTKLGRIAPGKVCNLSQITAVITDDLADPGEVERLEGSGVSVLVAGTRESPTTAKELEAR